MKIKIAITIIAFSAFLQVLISPLRGYVNLNTSTAVGYLAYLSYMAICSHLFSKKVSIDVIVASILTGICLVQFPIRIISFNSSLFTLPDMLSHILGALSFYLYLKLKGIYRWAFPFLLFLMVTFIVTKGYVLWGDILDNKAGEINENKIIDYWAKDQNGLMVKGTDFNRKFVLLDFWFIGCKPCYEEFPEFQKVYNEYKNNVDVKIIALNLPVKGDKANEAFDLLKQKGYSFPCLILESNKKTEAFGVKTCPTTVLLDKNRKIIFRGRLSEAEKFIKEILNPSSQQQ